LCHPKQPQTPQSVPRYPTFPATCDEVKRLEIGYLNQNGLLIPGHNFLSMRWTRRGQVTGRLEVSSHIQQSGTGRLRLRYQDDHGRSHDYEVQVVTVASNLPGSTGHRCYLVCPITHRRASILYRREDSGVFTHRAAFPGTQNRVYYDSQLVPKRFRGLARFLTVDRVWEEQYRKGRKTTYKGKPTKWYASLLTLENRATEGAMPALRALAQVGRPANKS
jgi:hypothetical protein